MNGMKERNKAVPAVYLALKRGSKVLMMLRQNTGYEDGKWYLPAGHVDAGEMPSTAMVREAEEEIGVSIAPEDLKLALSMYRGDHGASDRADYFFTCEKWEGEPINGEPEKCGGLEWFPLDAIPAGTSAHVAHALESIRDGKNLAELSVDWHRQRGF